MKEGKINMIKREEFRNVLKENPVLAILRRVEPEILENYVSAVIEGGVRFFEVAMNTPDAARQIQMLKTLFGEHILVGAGTVITSELAEKALKAGADFLLSPSVNVNVLEYCRDNEIALLPGALTPSEVAACMSYGCMDIKLFPAGEMPMSYVKSLKGPLDGTEYIAIGGVTEKNIERFFRNGYMGVGLGSSLLPNEIVEKRDWKAGKEYVRRLTEKAKGEKI